MKNTLRILVGLVLVGSVSACSFLPTFSEPELGAARASLGDYESAEGTSLVVNGVLFDSEQASLNPRANRVVSRAADYLKSNPGSQVVVEGHTDHLGPKRYNQKLSEKRAKAIVKALKAQGISSNRITAVGYGETQPVADNNTPDGRRANRRVEIILQNEF